MSADQHPVRVAVIFHSSFRGHTARLAQAIAAGAAKVPGAEVTLIPVEEVDARWDELHRADALIFGSPTYVGSVSAKFKEFIEKLAGDVWLQRAWLGKVAGGFTVSAGRSGDKLAALMQMFIFASQMGMVWVPLPMTGGNYSTAGSEDDLNRMAGYVGVMAQANIDEGPNLAPPASDLTTAELYAEHLTRIAQDLAAGRALRGDAAPAFTGKPRRLVEML